MELILCGLVTTFQTDEVERSGTALESPPVWRMIYLISRPGLFHPILIPPFSRRHPVGMLEGAGLEVGSWAAAFGNPNL